jgi:hypothetical protein
MKIGIRANLCGFVLYVYNKDDVNEDGTLRIGAKEYYQYFDETNDMEKCIKDFKKRAKKALK